MVYVVCRDVAISVALFAIHLAVHFGNFGQARFAVVGHVVVALFAHIQFVIQSALEIVVIAVYRAFGVAQHGRNRQYLYIGVVLLQRQYDAPYVDGKRHRARSQSAVV